MTPENFCYWLQGCLELNPGQPMSAQQVEMIAQHLALVFDKKTPKLNIDIETSPGWPRGFPNLFEQSRKLCEPREYRVTC